MYHFADVADSSRCLSLAFSTRAIAGHVCFNVFTPPQTSGPVVLPIYHFCEVGDTEMFLQSRLGRIKIIGLLVWANNRAVLGILFFLAERCFLSALSTQLAQVVLLNQFSLVWIRIVGLVIQVTLVSLGLVVSQVVLATPSIPPFCLISPYPVG